MLFPVLKKRLRLRKFKKVIPMKKIAAVNDLSGFGKCSLTAAIPVMSALGVQCCPLVTGVFSNQTGYDSFYCRDCTDDMVPCIEEWKKLGAEFDGILTRIDIERAIGRLTADEREVLALHLAGELSFKEISRIVGESMPAVYRKYRKALAALREHLGGNL